MRRQGEREVRSETKLAEGKASWDPATDPNATDSDAFKTLFVGRINHEVSESQLQRKFETYGMALSGFLFSLFFLGALIARGMVFGQCTASS